MEYKEFEKSFKSIESIYEPPVSNTIIYKVRDYSDNIFAIKIIKNLNDTFSRVMFTRECDALKKLNNYKNIVKIYDNFILTDKNWGCIVLEYIEGINLLNYIVSNQEMKTNQKYKIIIKLLETMDKAHKIGVIHRDLKPSNLMISNDIEMDIKVIDFGTSKIKDTVKIKYNQQLEE